MSEIKLSIAQHYHERTKYDPETIETKGHQLDWSQQPSPFKEYKLGTVIDLQYYLHPDSQTSTTDHELFQLGHRLSRLLLNTYGLTARIPTIMGDHYLRAAPSAGALYPAEIYVISRGTALLPQGIYNYQAKTHSLLQFWDSRVWPALQEGCFWHPVWENTHLAIALTSIFFRSAWRYQDRAYRRIFLDTGHILGNLELAAAMNNYRPHLIGGFHDEKINHMLYLNESQEATIALVALADLLQAEENLPRWRSALPSQLETDYPQIPDGQLLNYLHNATKLNSDTSGVQGWQLCHPSDGEKNNQAIFDKYNFPFCNKISTFTAPIDWGKNLAGLENTILKRRSTRAYTGDSINLEELNTILDFTYHPEHYVQQGLDVDPDYFDLSLISTFVAVLGVDGLETGCYYYSPVAQELRQMRFKNFQRELHYLCLGQDLGRDASAIIFHTADLTKAVDQYGDRVYRYLHFDAGHLGQKLNLGAIHLGLGASGIGGFFDNHVNEVLGIPTDEAVVYITTLGVPRSAS
jgi:SagB-type dehydrogenase family enzyme